jgi:GT2 family glycosyltransferase
VKRVVAGGVARARAVVKTELTAIARASEPSRSRERPTRDLTILEEPHHQSLELAAAAALAEGDCAIAFRLADRRCRIAPPPEPHSFVLRGLAAYRMGERAAAIADIAKALELAPDDIAANRKMLAWGQGAQRVSAAKALIGANAAPDTLRMAVEVLLADGRRRLAHVTTLDDRIEGWAVWRDDAPLEVAIADQSGSTTARIERDPLHPLSDLAHAARFVLPRPRSSEPQSITLSIAGQTVHSIRAPANERAARLQRDPPPQAAGEPSVSVIVPVHGDFDATRTCLETLFAVLDHAPRHRAVIVDDATPDPRIAAYLATLRSRPRITLLTNRSNLGFVGSINRALTAIDDGDVILLNADTIVPPGFIDRLAAAAHSSADIGAVTPLSNHGEFTSFPAPNIFNPLASPSEIVKIDAVAATRNRNFVVDIPSGIGFCLYVTRACLDAVGQLSEDFHRGYLEDVDFCLRAREHGFRSVCAAAVYVGHAGSRSFGQEKRGLVVRNLRVLERRFPSHRQECAAFMRADPLRTARQSIERALAPPPRRPILLVSGAGAVGAVALARARQLASQGRSTIIVEARRGADGTKVSVFDPAGGLPQSIQFGISSSRERVALIAYIRGLRPARMEILDPGALPIPLMRLLLAIETRHDLFIADAGLLERRGDSLATTAMGPRAAPAWRADWREIADKARRILAPCGQAQAFAAAVLPERKILRVDPSRSSRRATIRFDGEGDARRLGVVPVRSCADEQRQIAEIARVLRERRPDASIVVIGATLDDLALMRLGNVFVTGRCEAAEFERLIRANRLGALFLNLSQPLFGHPIVAQTLNTRLPAAYRDWSAGGLEPRPGDLAIPARANPGTIADELAKWLPGQ